MKMPTPFLGRALIEAIHEDVDAFLAQKRGVSEELIAKGFQVINADVSVDPETGKRTTKLVSNATVPLHRGKILEMAPDFGGENFKNKCGQDVGYVPTIGDIVWFVPNETFAIDAERKYHLINDCDIVGYERGVENV